MAAVCDIVSEIRLRLIEPDGLSDEALENRQESLQICIEALENKGCRRIANCVREGALDPILKKRREASAKERPTKTAHCPEQPILPFSY